MIDDPVRIAAAVAGIVIFVVLAAPFAAGFAGDVCRLIASMRSAVDDTPVPFPSPLPEPLRSLGDMRFVLELAARLQAAGKVQAVKLCQQLIDEMLAPHPPAKGKKE